MQFFVWQQGWDRPVDVKDVKIPNGWSRSLVLMGQRVEDNLPDLHVILAKNKHPSDALINQWNWLFFSPKLQQALDASTDDAIQYLDLMVTQGSKGKRIPGYRLCNPLVSIPAIDRERSNLVFHEGTDDILGIDSLVLDAAKIGNFSFFRLKEYSPALVVREDVAEGVVRRGCTGMRFLPIEKYKR